MCANSVDHEGQNQAAIKLTGYGLVCLLIAVPAVLALIDADMPNVATEIGPLPVPDPTVSIDWLPDPTDTEFELVDWLGDLAADVAVIGVIGGYYLSLLSVGLGVLLVGYGLVAVNSVGSIFDGLRRRTNNPVVRLMLVVYGIGLLAVFVPAVMAALVEVIIVVAVGGTLLAVLGGGWWWLRATARPLVRIGLVYPLGIAAIVLPVIITGLISPTFASMAQSISVTIAEVILTTVIAAIGLESAVRDAFDLEGWGYVGMWGGLALVIGWALGAVVELLLNK